MEENRAAEVEHDPLPVLESVAGGSGSSTAKLAMRMLTEGDSAFHEPTRAQRRNLAMAFAARDKILYGRAFDAVRLVEGPPVDLDDLTAIEAGIDRLLLYEIKSTNRRNLDNDFRGYFFALTAAELLVSQSLGDQFRFLLIHTLTGHRLELDLQGVFQRARSIYPSWSVLF